MQSVFVYIPSLLSISRESIQPNNDQTFVVTLPNSTVIHGRDVTNYSFVIQKEQFNPFGELLPFLHMIAFRTINQTVLLHPDKETAKKKRSLRCTVHELQEAVQLVCQPKKTIKNKEINATPNLVSASKRLSLSNRAQRARIISKLK